jgi:hypothetical protein
VLFKIVLSTYGFLLKSRENARVKVYRSLNLQAYLRASNFNDNDSPIYINERENYCVSINRVGLPFGGAKLVIELAMRGIDA